MEKVPLVFLACLTIWTIIIFMVHLLLGSKRTQMGRKKILQRREVVFKSKIVPQVFSLSILLSYFSLLALTLFIDGREGFSLGEIPVWISGSGLVLLGYLHYVRSLETE